MHRKPDSVETIPSVWHILRHFWPQIRTQKKLITGSLLALLAETGFRALEPIPLKIIFDRAFASHLRHPGHLHYMKWLNNVDPLTVLAWASAAMILITILRALADYFNTIGFSLVGNRILTAVRGEV